MLKTLSRFLSRSIRRVAQSESASNAAGPCNAASQTSGRRSLVLGEGVRQALEQDRD